MPRDIGDVSTIGEVTSDYLVRIVDNPNSEYPTEKLIPGAELTPAAGGVSVADAGGYYTGSNVETVLAELPGKFAPPYVVNAATYGDGVTDAAVAINALITQASADGGGYVYLPPGTYVIDTNVASITPLSNVAIGGAGVGRTIIKPTGAGRAIYATGTALVPISDVLIENLEIDGIGHANGGTYTSAMKGIQINYCLRHTYRDLYIHHCGATGLGSDYLVDSVMERVIADNNGRLNNHSEAGGAGIGIGTGVYAVESITVRDCVTRNNGTLGVFWENQSGISSTGARLVNHYSSGNYVHGIADCGVNGLQIIGGVSTANVKSGLALYRGTYAGGTGPGEKTYVQGLDTNSNTEHGIHIDCTVRASGGKLVFDGVRSWGNTIHGVWLNVGSGNFSSFAMQGCQVYLNGQNGLLVSSAGGVVTDVLADSCHFRANGTNTGAAAANRAGVYVSTSVTQFRFTSNRCWDDQGSKTQTHGLTLATVTITAGTAENNDLGQNLTAGISTTATLSSFRLGLNNLWTINTGSPEGVVSAGIGTIYRRLDGGASTTFYVKESGTGNTGWVAK